MKILKILAVILGIVLLVSLLLKMLQKSTKTSISFEGIDRIKNTATVSVFANDQRINVYDIPLQPASEQTYSANDYMLIVSQIGKLMFFVVKDDQGRQVAKKPVDKDNAPNFIIYSE